jgi:hypothetical protein
VGWKQHQPLDLFDHRREILRGTVDNTDATAGYAYSEPDGHSDRDDGT